MSTSPNRMDDLRTLRWATYDVAFAVSFGTLVVGTFLVAFVKHLGGSDQLVSATGALPSIVGLLQIFGGAYGRSFHSYKKFVLPCGTLWRLGYLPFCFLPLLPMPDSLKLVIVCGCMLVASAAAQIGDPIYNDWLAELVPINSRGAFFSRRNAVAAGVSAGIGVLGGLIFDHYKSIHKETLGYTTVFSMGLFCAAISLFCFLQMQDRRRENVVSVKLKELVASMKVPYSDRDFRRVLLFLFMFVLGQTFVNGLLSAFALESLNMPLTLLQFCGLTQAIGQVILAKWWGYFADKYGNKPVLAFLCLGLVLTPVMWFFTKPNDPMWNAAVLIPGHIFSGFIWGGVGASQFNLLLRTSKDEQRANYIAAGQSLVALTGGLAPLIGGMFMTQFRPHMPVYTAYLSVLAICMFFRVIAVLFLLPVKEEGAISIRTTFKQLRKASPSSFRAIRQLMTSPDMLVRERAMQQVGEKKLEIASDEVVKFLHDPSPRLRRQAAQTLARMGDETSAAELIHQLEQHPTLVEEETIRALGIIGDESAVSALIPYLNSPRGILRRAAARALGRIEGDRAEEALIQAAAVQGDPDLRRASLQALRSMNATHANDIIASSCMDRDPAVRVAAAEAIVELGIAEAAPKLRESLSTYYDEANTELAYSLGAIGTRSDIPRILTVAATCTSMITRRRCLLGVARQFGVEADAYRLLLAEGMVRDQSLVEAIPTRLRANSTIATALQLLSAGHEDEAIQVLAKRVKLLEPFAAEPVPEASIVAMLVAVDHLSKQRKK